MPLLLLYSGTSLLYGDYFNLYSIGMKIWLETPLKIKYGYGLNRVKDDKADAEMIAYYARRFMNQIV